MGLRWAIQALVVREQKCILCVIPLLVALDNEGFTQRICKKVVRFISTETKLLSSLNDLSHLVFAETTYNLIIYHWLELDYYPIGHI